MIDVIVQNVSDSPSLPSEEKISVWVNEANVNSLAGEVVVRMVDLDEMIELNETYRKKTGPTNILSFPATIPEGVEFDVMTLGDLVVCVPVVAQEAIDQNKKVEDHWAHMLIHGFLHLQGYDHVIEEEAEAMETKEIEILNKLDIDNPYQSSEVK